MNFFLFLSAVGPCCCTWAFYSSHEQELLFFGVKGLLLVVASLVAVRGLQGAWAQQCGAEA